MGSVEAMAERVTEGQTAGGGEVDGDPQVFHGGWGWHQLSGQNKRRMWTVLFAGRRDAG
jgi:hypothetical protein